MSADVYSSLLKALAMPDKGDTSCYPVRVSAAGAIAALLEVDLWMNPFGLCNGVHCKVILVFHLAIIFLLFRMTMRHLSGYLYLKVWLVGLVMKMKRAPFYSSFWVQWWRLEMKLLQFIYHILFHHWWVQSQSGYLQIWSHGLKYVWIFLASPLVYIIFKIWL